MPSSPCSRSLSNVATDLEYGSHRFFRDGALALIPKVSYVPELIWYFASFKTSCCNDLRLDRASHSFLSRWQPLD